MSQVPMGASIGDGKFGFPFGPRVGARYADVGGLVPQGISAELIADKWGLSREDLDTFSAESQRRAAQATAEGRFENEIVPVRSIHRDKDTGDISESDELVAADEGIREGTTVETLANLKPAFKPDGKVTAGNSSQITDGASAVLIMSEERAAALGLRPRARFHTFALAGVDPVTMLTGPIPATQKVIEKSGLSLADIDLFEVNEAFASVVLAWEKETGADLGRTNVNGGAIALGHPLGCSGTKLLATLLNELERTGGRYGLQTMCEGGGMANATIIERLG
jgi:acetyl-CoA acyltransferase